MTLQRKAQWCLCIPKCRAAMPSRQRLNHCVCRRYSLPMFICIDAGSFWPLEASVTGNAQRNRCTSGGEAWNEVGPETETVPPPSSGNAAWLTGSTNVIILSFLQPADPDGCSSAQILGFQDWSFQGLGRTAAIAKDHGNTPYPDRRTLLSFLL